MASSHRYTVKAEDYNTDTTDGTAYLPDYDPPDRNVVTLRQGRLTMEDRGKNISIGPDDYDDIIAAEEQWHRERQERKRRLERQARQRAQTIRDDIDEFLERGSIGRGPIRSLRRRIKKLARTDKAQAHDLSLFLDEALGLK